MAAVPGTGSGGSSTGSSTSSSTVGSVAGSASNLFYLIRRIIFKLNTCIRFNAQTLTDEQKAVARDNIGAMSADDIEAIANSGVVVSTEPPENTNVLWIDVDDYGNDSTMNLSDALEEIDAMIGGDA